MVQCTIVDQMQRNAHNTGLSNNKKTDNNNYNNTIPCAAVIFVFVLNVIKKIQADLLVHIFFWEKILANTKTFRIAISTHYKFVSFCEFRFRVMFFKFFQFSILGIPFIDHFMYYICMCLDFSFWFFCPIAISSHVHVCTYVKGREH